MTSTHFINQRLRHPLYKWDYVSLSSNKALTWQMVQENPTIPWNWYALCKNENIVKHMTWSFIQERVEKPLQFRKLSKVVPLQIILDNPDNNTWDYCMVSARSEITIELVVTYPDFPWRWDMLFNNPSVSIDVLRALPDKPWSWNWIHYLNSTRRIEDIINLARDLPHKPWNWDGLSGYKHLTLHIVKTNIDLPWNWNVLILNANIHVCDILDNLHLPWNLSKLTTRIANDRDWAAVRDNPDLPWDWDVLIRKDLCANPPFEIIYMNKEKKWDLKVLSKQENITWQIVKDHPELPWDWTSLSINPNITLEIVISNPDIPWSWVHFTQNKSITWDIIQDNPCSPWSWKHVNYNPNVTSSIVESNPDALYWDWYYWSRSASWSLIQKLHYKNWDWNIICKRRDIDWSVVIDLSDKPWNWNELIKNISRYDADFNWRTVIDNVYFLMEKGVDLSLLHSLPWQVVKNNPREKWDWCIISRNPNMLKLTLYEAKYLACLRIQRQWRKCISDPSYTLCKRRLLYDIEHM